MSEANSKKAEKAKRPYGTGSLVQKGPNKWLVRVYLGPDPARPGKPLRKYVTINGSKRAAQIKLNEILREKDQGLIEAVRDQTVGVWLDRWLEQRHAGGHLSDSVRGRYQGIIENHLLPTLGDLLLRDLKPAQIAALQERWLTGGGANEPLSPATVYKHMNVLSAAMSEALKQGLIARNPVSAVSRPSPAAAIERRAFDEDEIRALREVAGETRYDVPIRFTLATGVRQGELLSLRWDDINFEKGHANIRGTKTKNSRRTLELSATTVELLRGHRALQNELKLRSIHNLVFPCELGTPWHRRNLLRGYRRILSKSNIAHPATANWHTLRHTAASLLILQGVDIFTVSRRLGHASASFTMDTYAHLLKGQQQAAAEALDHLLA